jgi:putative tryptophan/tyrosine transport system substrate-binding protein
MKRRAFIAGLGSTAVWPVAARAQQDDRVRQIGILTALSDRGAIQSSVAEVLARAGWVEGRNIRFEYRFGAGDAERTAAYAAELIGRSPDVILCNGTLVTSILKQRTSTIPVVFVNVADPVASGLVASFAHPGSNITGFTSVEFSLAGKWLTLLKDLVPELSTVMMLYDHTNPIGESYLHTIELAASTLRVSIRAAPAENIDQMERRIESFAYQRGAGMIVVPGGQMVNNREMITALAQRHRVPAIYPYKAYATSGGLASYGSDTIDLYRRAAQYVDRILKGAKPAELPVQAPTKFEFVLNLRAAKAIGLSVPNSLQLLADEVIE